MLEPPCQTHSAIFRVSKGSMDPGHRKALVSEGLLHFHHAVDLALIQYRGGRAVVLEHPDTASSWEDPRVVQLAALPGVQAVSFDMCCFGLSVNPEGKLSRKRIWLLTNDTIVVDMFRKYQCSRDHEYFVLD
eukprot:2826007-Pyramimonas_sp.AAC.2